MNEAVRKAVQEQIQAEFESAYLYLAMALTCRDRGLPGTAHWLTVQYHEELGHAMKFIEHAHARAVSVEFGDIHIKRVEWNTIGELFRHVLQHEQYITSRIHTLFQLAQQHNDYAIMPLLQWFIEEQVEEEESVRTILDQIAMVGESGPSLYLLDRQLGSRDEKD